MVQIQQQLHRGEEVYFEDTHQHGNIFKGWESFVDAKYDVGGMGMGMLSSSRGGEEAAPAVMGPPRRIPLDSRWFSSSCESVSKDLKLTAPPAPQEQSSSYSQPTITVPTTSSFTTSIMSPPLKIATSTDAAAPTKMETITEDKEDHEEIAAAAAANANAPEQTKEEPKDVEMKDAASESSEEEKEAIPSEEEDSNPKKRKEPAASEDDDDEEEEEEEEEEPPKKKQEIEKEEKKSSSPARRKKEEVATPARVSKRKGRNTPKTTPRREATKSPSAESQQHP
ncbi:MAG: hypothetical protein SGARI_001961 [Bacillariaceae sp.]